MRKPLHTPCFSMIGGKINKVASAMWMLLLSLALGHGTTMGQCIPESGVIKGTIFNDANLNGIYDAEEEGASLGQIILLNTKGEELLTAVPSSNGYYEFVGLDDGQEYSLVFASPSYMNATFHGSDHPSDVLSLVAPACNVYFGLNDPTTYCDSDNPFIAATCFVRGGDGENEDMETVVFTPYLFNNQSGVQKVAAKGQTGSVFGTAWASGTQKLYTSSFVKQDAFLENGPGVVFESGRDANGMFQTRALPTMTDLGVDVGVLSVTDANDCEYGSQVGKIGLGGMEISPDEATLFVINLYKKSIVAIDLRNPARETTMEIAIPYPSCRGGQFRPFAIKYYQGLYYITATCDASSSKNSNDHHVAVLTFDFDTKLFEEVFSTSFTRAYWQDSPSDAKNVAQWLTDIAFTDDGNMVLGIADRTAHRYCHPRLELVNQFPDILMVWNDNGVWKLESNGIAGTLRGSGIGNGQGPGGGEFFGEDFWILGPLYHPETATGTLFSLPGSDQVVATVFDPLYNTFAGGYHRYSTKNGKKLAAIELFSTGGGATFGKGSGLGNIVDMCDPAPIQIGNLVWIDTNKDGLQNANEKGVPNVELTLYDDQCKIVGTTLTNSDGTYYFDSQLSYHQKYFVVVSDSRWNQADGVMAINGKEYELTLFEEEGRQRNSDAYEGSAICPELEGRWVVNVYTSGPGFVNHTFDIGLSEPTVVVLPQDTFDLALMKRVLHDAPVRLGEVIDYEITVFNQGNVIAQNIQVVDYLPEGLNFPGIINPGWVTQNGNPTYTIIDQLAPGESVVLHLSMQVQSATNVEGYTNYAEIVSAEDTNGNVRDDIDSTPDDTVDNDNGGQPGSVNDDRYDDDGTEDEDDHDPATLNVLDLALVKTTDFAQTVRPGDEITYTITIVNQGNMAVKSIEVVDYLPVGLVYSPNDVNGWSENAHVLSKTIDQALSPGETIQIEVLIRVTEDAASGNLINYAEIAGITGMDDTVYDYDLDSTPDEIVDNDQGGQVNTDTDDKLDGNGLDDEDDHDPERLYVFDLALKKEASPVLVQSATQDITYSFTVYNQGEIDAKSIEITDYLPDGLLFGAAKNPGWVQSAPGKLVYNIDEVLKAGESVVITLILNLDEDYFDQDLINIAEITQAFDINSIPCLDFDSTPDDDPANDVGGQVGTSTDNQVDDHGVVDEDDHDPAVVRGQAVIPQMVDVALAKRGVAHHFVEDTVVFQFTVYNQGTTTLGEVVIADYLPFFLISIDPNWESMPFGIMFTANVDNGFLPSSGLMGGDSIDFYLTTVIDHNAFPGFIINAAEIGSLKDLDGNDVSSLDKDSHADFDPTNDVSDNPKESQGGAGPGTRPIEDDRAAFEFLICTIERGITCQCLNNDIGEIEGQFSDEIIVTSHSGETWYIDFADGFYDPASADPPAAPTPFVTGPGGYILTETVIGGDLSTYSLTGVYPNESSYYLILKNVEHGLAHSISGGQECSYSRPGIHGATNACIGSTATYSVVNPTSGGTYQWYVDPAGGTIVGSSNGPAIEVQWNPTPGGPYTMWVREVSPDDCTGPSSIEVILGDQFAYSISCIQDAQISLGPDCDTKVTAEMLLVGGPYDYNSFSVSLMDENGQPISGAILDSRHIGQKVMATVANTCTGNSCWAWLTVEDKLAPIVRCYDDTISCISLEQYTYPHAIDGCDPSPVVTMINETVEPLECDNQYIKRITRTFVAEDQYGNVSKPCQQVVMLRRIVLDDIVYPDSLTLAKGQALQCNAFVEDTNGFPDPETYGIPTYEGRAIWPQEYYCNVGVDYRDIELPSSGCVRKIIREWRVFEWWCDQAFEVVSYPQYIQIVDTVAPTIQCIVPDYVVSSPRTCDADVYIEAPEVEDDCSDIIRVDLIYPGGIIENFTSQYVTLPVDTHLLKFRVYDQCFNVDSCTFEVIVMDNTPPVAVCDQYTTVGLTDTGYAYIYAETFDDLSFDNCFLKKMEVKRMDEGRNCGFVNDQFGPYVEFCCEDVGSNVMVLFQVTDKSGNTNTCMVEVEVQDKVPPRIYCPADDTINCSFHYDTSDLSIFGEPLVYDNCDYQLESRVYESVDQCREGYIERVWIARDQNNVTSCSQKIYIINDDPFDEDDITWPLDYETSECRHDFLLPDSLPTVNAYPIVDEDFCDLVGMNYTDHRFSFTQNGIACYKILRKWEVVNWCRFDSSVYDTWTHEQVIIVHNNVPPVITSNCEKVEKCVYDDCEIGYMELGATASDDCTEGSELRWEYHIDLNKDGTIDYSGSGVGSVLDASRELALGSHRVTYAFEDKCGNRSVCVQEFDIFNCKPPTAYCKNGLIVDLVVMDLDGDGQCDNEMVEVWARDLDEASYSLCDYPLTYSFGRDTTIKSMVFDCKDIGRNELEICVTDPRGYVSCCSTFLVVQDNNDMDCCSKEFDKDCVQGPGDVHLDQCDASTDPFDLMSFPVTATCEVDSVKLEYTDEDGTNGDNCLKIKRTWEVTLYLDGKDTTCTYVHCITIDNEFTLDSIMWPADTLILLGCDNSLDTSNTGGVPVIKGEYCDYVTMTYSDIQVEGDDEVCTYFERTWTITNACDNDKEYTFRQLIIFQNQRAPILIPPANVTVNNDPTLCGAYVSLPPVTYTDCSTGVIIENDENGNGEDASDFYGVGTHVVEFTATDACGNVSRAQVVVVVEDDEAPRMICPDNFTLDCDVDLDTVAFELPVVIDNCSSFTLRADTLIDLNDCGIGEITLTYTATDSSGNVNSCTQVVTIESSMPFDSTRIVWPSDTVRISACESSDPDSTGRPTVDVSGLPCSDVTIVYMDTMYMGLCDGDDCTIIERKWTVTDSCTLDTLGGGMYCFVQRIEMMGALFFVQCPNDTTIYCENGLGDLSLYGDVTVMSDCGLDTIIRDSSASLNQCEVGTVTRTFTVRDTLGHELMCSQVITIEIRDPFAEVRITWPADTVQLNECDSVTLDRTGQPTLDTSGLSCFDLTIVFQDTMYAGMCEGEPCEIIERTWTVTDSCQLGGTGSGVWTFEQRIEILGGMLSIGCPADTTIYCEDGLGDLSLYGDVVATSDCGVDTIIRDSSASLNQCGVGTVTRTFTVRDSAGHELTCSQVITIEIRDPFAEVRITWPMDTVQLGECDSLTPDRTGQPILDTSGLSCFDLSIVFEDTMYAGMCEGVPCEIIERTWTVTDSCQLDGMGNGVWTFDQRIEILGDVLLVQCPNDTTISCDADISDLSRYGELVVIAPCGIDTIIRDTIFALNDCGLGTITRSVVVRDTIGNEVSCAQVITIESTEPFDESHITWPEDTLLIVGCISGHPDSLMSRPMLDTLNSTCENLSITYADSSTSACTATPCLVIHRRWTITDSCQLDSMGNGIWTFDQRIEVNDTVAPMPVGSFDTTVYVSDTICEADITSLVVAFDDCSDSITITNNSPFARSSGRDAGGVYPLGVTEFYFYAEDGCCNLDSALYRVDVRDTFPPHISCTKVIKIMRDSIVGVTFCAHETLDTLFDNCQYDITEFTISFSPTDPFDTCVTYNCDSLLATGLPDLRYDRYVYVTDPNGNVDSCVALLQVQDESGCITRGLTVGGQVLTSRSVSVEEAEVYLQGAQTVMNMTDEFGVYQFNDMPAGGVYVVNPYKNNDVLNGVSMKDLILIQRHLLGTEEITDPYSLIAADINKSDDISTADIMILRRLLLGYYNEFPDNTSWRFVQSDYQFPRPLDPWYEVFPENYAIDPLIQTMFVNFTGVKIGDISGDVHFGWADNATRSDFSVDLKVVEEGDWLHIVKESGRRLSGMQFTLEYVPTGEPIELMYDTDRWGEFNFGFHSLELGRLTVVMDKSFTGEEEVLFSLPKASIKEGLRVSSVVTEAIAYDEDLNPGEIRLHSKSAGDRGYALYPNKPNPFDDGTVIGFEIPVAQKAQLTIMNMSGQVVYKVDGDFERGYNEIELKAKVLGASGVYYYRLDCNGFTQTKKMISIK